MDKHWRFLGTGFIAYGHRNYVDINEAKKYIHKLKLKNTLEDNSYLNQNKLPNNIPAGAAYVYKNKGWKGWGDYLGTGRLSHKIEYMTYEQARIF